MMLSKNFSLREMYYSSTAHKAGIDNLPHSVEVRSNMELLVKMVLQPIRESLAEPIQVTSGYRSVELNKLVKGARNSDHLYGRAVDIKSSNMKKLWNVIRELIDEGMEFDQLIDEYNLSWIHISYRDGDNRCEILSCKNGKYHKIS